MDKSKEKKFRAQKSIRQKNWQLSFSSKIEMPQLSFTQNFFIQKMFLPTVGWVFWEPVYSKCSWNQAMLLARFPHTTAAIRKKSASGCDYCYHSK